MFIDVILTGDVYLLTITGKPNYDELVAAWQEILIEYSSLIRTDKSESIFECWKKVLMTQQKITVLGFSLYALKVEYDEELAMVIHQMGYDKIEPLEDRQQYLTQIYRVETEAKSLVVFLNQYIAEYKALNPDADNPTQATDDRLRYDKDLAILSRFMKYRIVKETTTVAEYCAIANLYIEYSKQLKDGTTI